MAKIVSGGERRYFPVCDFCGEYFEADKSNAECCPQSTTDPYTGKPKNCRSNRSNYRKSRKLFPRHIKEGITWEQVYGGLAEGEDVSPAPQRSKDVNLHLSPIPTIGMGNASEIAAELKPIVEQAVGDAIRSAFAGLNIQTTALQAVQTNLSFSSPERSNLPAPAEAEGDGIVIGVDRDMKAGWNTLISMVALSGHFDQLPPDVIAYGIEKGKIPARFGKTPPSRGGGPKKMDVPQFAPPEFDDEDLDLNL